MQKLLTTYCSPLDVLDEEEDGFFDILDFAPEFGFDTIASQLIALWILSGIDLDDFMEEIVQSEDQAASDFDGWDDDNELSNGWVLVGNVTGIIPFGSPASADVFFVLCGSVMTFVTGTMVMLALKGLRFMGFFVPVGAPLLFAVFLSVIDLISHLSRIVSLSIRIVANITAGQALLKIILGFSWDFFTSLSMFSIFGIFPSILFFIIVALEMFIALLQGYIFSVLNGSYQHEITA